MAEAVDLSLSRLTPSDIDAMVVYLRSVPAIRDADLPKVAGAAPRSPAAGALELPVGKRIFEGECASCHAWDGAGAIVSQAQLAGLRAVNDRSAANVVKMTLFGSSDTSSGGPLMPGFAASLSDTEIAEVANFVTRRFGAAPSRMSAAGVAKLRADG